MQVEDQMDAGKSPAVLESQETLEPEVMSKMPKAVYFILPNECAERFCFYGINPILNPFFSKYLGMGKEKALQYTHLFKVRLDCFPYIQFASYFTPLGGAAISDSFLGKYDTIVLLSFVYVIGTALLATFAVPSLKSEGMLAKRD
jgi:dipeptide/tripeptide permease